MCKTHNHVVKVAGCVQFNIKVREVEEDAVAGIHTDDPGTVHIVRIAVRICRGMNLPRVSHDWTTTSCEGKESEHLARITLSDIKTTFFYCAVCCPSTSLDFGPAGVETATADVSVRLEAHGQQVASAGHLHGGGGGGAKLGQLRSCEVWAAIHLRRKQERIQGFLGGILPQIQVSLRSMTHLQHVIIAILMVLDVELMDGDGDAAASCGCNVPDALSVFWVSVGVVRAVEGTTWSRELPSTTCTATNSTGSVKR